MHEKQSTLWQPGLRPTDFRPRPARRAFTLTELLIVIAIIAVLTGLLATAAVNAMRNGRRTAILLDIQNISGALENLKGELGAYPPNAMNPNPTNNPPTGSPAALVQADFKRMFTKAFPRHREPPVLIAALCGQNVGAPANSNLNLDNGMNAAEALVFWLGGFSENEQFPISGPGGPSFDVNDIEALEDRRFSYEFDITKLGPRDDDGVFAGRPLLYEVDLNGDTDFDDLGEKRRINFWQYRPGSSEQPLVYFDVSRYKPYQYDVWSENPGPSYSLPVAFAFKQRKSGATGMPGNPAQYQSMIVFVDQGKFQILHPGLDDAWGREDFQMMSLDKSTNMGWGEAEFSTIALYPDGPYIGEIGDTLTNFAEGELADVTEE